MAKSSLPKVISRANKEISTIIETDIQKESELLKNLVDEVLAANVEVKKKNNQRILDTRRKLQELDIEIDELNQSIDLVDRETVIEQLNQMIDAENKIFAARQEIRFFENEHLDDQLGELDSIYNSLTESVAATKRLEETYKALLTNANDMFFDKQLEVTNDMIALMKDMVQDKREHAKTQVQASEEIKATIRQKELDAMNELDRLFKDIAVIQLDSTSVFTDIDDEVLMGEQITVNHHVTLGNIEDRVIEIDDAYERKHNEIIESYRIYEETTRQKLEVENKQALQQEKIAQQQKDEELKNIRLLIIDAEKKQDLKKVQSLIKKFEKLEKQDVAVVTGKTDKMLAQETKATKDKTIDHLKHLHQKYVTDKMKQEFAKELEDIEYEEAKILFKIKSDRNALAGDLEINKRKIQRLDEYYQLKKSLFAEIQQMRLELRLFELDIMMDNEAQENELLKDFSNLIEQLVEFEQKRLLALQENLSNHDIIKIEQQYEIGKAVLDLQLSRDIADIDKRILKAQNESLIQVEKKKEDANSDIIYQESLIKIAQKERELQLKKVHSLYENERGLAEEQVERINLGIQVNDTFVKTTLQNQLLFAEQQIKCAQSEFDIRVENINLTKDQELAYANKKINYYRQKFEYEKSKLKKERDDKLEDLNFKLLLFTDDKENKRITEQIESLKATYQKMIDAIEADEHADPNIKRYEKVIDASEARAQKAINEAAALRDQTVEAFEALYHQTNQKVVQIEDTHVTPDTAGIMPLLNSGAASSADDRLQQAIVEADELYEDRIKEPNEIINATKEQLLRITEDQETKAFVETQKELKKVKITEHAERMERLHDIMEEALLATTDEVERGKLIQKKLLEQQYDSFVNAPLYRDPSAIQNDYEALKQKERDYAQLQIDELDRIIKQQLLDHKRVLKETNHWIKVSIKPYKRYIRRASKGLRAEKRELNRKHARILKKALADAEDEFSVDL